jgi:hypothetical protein
MIYIAIRRGLMAVPTVGTSVFGPLLNTGTDTAKNVTGTGWPVDLAFTKLRNASGIDIGVFDRLRGTRKVFSSSTSAEGTGVDAITGFAVMDGMAIGVDGSFALTNRAPNTYVYECFRRAPSFFDEVCFTSTSGFAASFTHNLGVTPELVIFKNRQTGGGSGEWMVYSSGTGNNQNLVLNTTAAVVTQTGFIQTLNSTTVLTGAVLAQANQIYVSYLFATCAGVSKVGSYTGTAAAQTINCGFTSGARFVLIKRTDSTGGWLVWDSARGIIPSNDPYFALNSTAAEVTGTDYIDTTSVGFDITSTAPAEINASGGTYIFLAIA